MGHCQPYFWLLIVTRSIGCGDYPNLMLQPSICQKIKMKSEHLAESEGLKRGEG